MRKWFALAMVALLAGTIALAAVGCGKKAEESTESTTPAETSMPSDSGMMSGDSTMHMADTTSHP
jgi:hypothetical protein